MSKTDHPSSHVMLPFQVCFTVESRPDDHEHLVEDEKTERYARRAGKVPVIRGKMLPKTFCTSSALVPTQGLNEAYIAGIPYNNDAWKRHSGFDGSGPVVLPAYTLSIHHKLPTLYATSYKIFTGD